jgi:macrophage erythroblast attacher
MILVELDSTRSIKRRVEHLQEVESFDEKTLPLWQKTRLDRMLVEYFLRAGYYSTALQLARHSNIEVCVNYVTFAALCCKQGSQRHLAFGT